jgi:hypothetical protein
MENAKFCKTCVSCINSKPFPTCKSSKSKDMVTGGLYRPCFIERLDGLGRCGTMGNNYTKETVKVRVAESKQTTNV